MKKLNVLVVKPSKYRKDGFVERFHRGFMPNATVPYIHSLIPDSIGDTRIHVTVVDEYVRTDLDYLDLFDAREHGPTLVLLVGVQSHQFHRALDLAALARKRGCMAVVGGPHPMTCDTSILQGRDISFALSEAESVLPTILRDAIEQGQLQPTYGEGQRWATILDPPVLKMPSKDEMRRHVAPLLGVYPARGCPFVCSFCAVIKIAGRQIRSQPVNTTMATLKAAEAAGVKTVFFTSDNFNKYDEAQELCHAIIEQGIRLKFFIQCDTQIARQPELLELFARAGVFQIFLGIESLNLATLKKAHKTQNRPDTYQQIKRMCDVVGISTHFSMINGFPDDTYESVLGQLGTLIEIDPSMASFYTLCPIPGTQQYDEFMQQGLIVETNLDRFDTICPTWKHPHLSWEQLDELFCRCYWDFYSFRRAVRYQPTGRQISTWKMWQYTLFSKYCSLQGDHPMSGGVLRKRADSMADYIGLRQETYGVSLVPLPDSLRLSAGDRAINDKAKIKVHA